MELDNSDAYVNRWLGIGINKANATRFSTKLNYTEDISEGRLIRAESKT